MINDVYPVRHVPARQRVKQIVLTAETVDDERMLAAFYRVFRRGGHVAAYPRRQQAVVMRLRRAKSC